MSDKIDTTLPDPSELPYSADEWDFLYGIWAVWSETGKKFLPSQLIAEYKNGYGWILDGIMSMESFYSKTKEEMRPKQEN